MVIRKRFGLVLILLAAAILLITPGDVEAMSSEPAEEETATELEEVPEGHIRFHFQNEADDYEGLGLWLWNDVAEWSEDKAGWPEGATLFTENPRTDYGTYVDVELAEDPEEIGFLINNTEGENLSGDLRIDILDEDLDEVWIQESGGDYEVHLTEPIDLADNKIRIHYYREDGDYDDWGLWKWGDVVEPSEDIAEWPIGATDFSADQIGEFGAYVDIELKENPDQINFLAVNQETEDQTADINLSTFSDNQLFFRQGDDSVYTNPYYVSEAGLESGSLLAEAMELRFSSTEGLTTEELEEDLVIEDSRGEEVSFTEVEIKDETVVEVKGDFATEQAPYEATFADRTAQVIVSWRLIDDKYAYDGDLGPELHADGSATLKLWSPGADNVSIILYDKDDQYEVVAEDIDMNLEDSGVWEVTLDEENTGVSDLTGYYYHYAIERDGETKLGLDPYASSMAAWNNNPDDPDKEYPVGKAAIVDPSEVGPELDFPDIENFDQREDAIIYEVHVRDFTSDPEIEPELDSQFGTFAAFKERLDYIEEMGVTHVQLLPIMSYFYGDELANDERMLDYSSSGNNYNWGYDPHSYFSISGMYSENPRDPEQRIEEFKRLIDEIHSRDMGVILDVVYNHTARVHIFENLVPNYYHFMDADGTTRTSFGGGRLGTTHEMARRILVDSITYWVEEFNVDGFRFDMMGDHDAESIEQAYKEAKEINPDILMIGEGWRTYVGDENDQDVMPADQDWMQHTETVGVFSDDFRNMIKSGFGAEAEPRFITGGPINFDRIIDNIKAQPQNFEATDPGDVVQYIEAHDNLTVHDVIAIATENDPDYNQEEIQKRLRLGNLMVLTAQGKAFIHAGQEYGRTKQFRAETDEAPYSSFKGVDEDGEPFDYPYFIDDSYDSTDAINMIEWSKIREEGVRRDTVEYTRGLIELRQSTDAFRLGDMDLIDENVSAVKTADISGSDLAAAYRVEATSGEAYYVFVNADEKARDFGLEVDLTTGDIVVDAEQAGTEAITDPVGVEVSADGISLDALTATVIKVD